MTRYICFRIAWMKNYKGTWNDIPTGAGSFVKENQDGGEVFNFHPIRGKYYGYVRIQNNRSLRLERLGAESDQDILDDVTVIFFSRNPLTGGQYIVGWYKHATLYRNRQTLGKAQRKDHPTYLTFTDVANGRLIPVDDRIFEIPKDGPGQSNVWYVEQYKKNYLSSLKKYLENPDSYVSRQNRRQLDYSRWNRDAEERKAIEVAAMKTVAKYFLKRGYKVQYVHRDNLGWDLEAKRREQILLLEVKGLSGEFVAVDLTANEYSNSQVNRKHYRICVVSNILARRNKLQIFYWKDKVWISDDNKILKPKKMISARFFYDSFD